MKQQGKTGIAALLGLASMATAIGIDGTLPAMPAMITGLDASRTSVQLSLSLFMVGVASGQLVHGPLSDRLGRKPVLIAGLLMTAVSTAGCAAATSPEALSVLRFLHGVAASSGFVVARAVVRDRFERDDAASVLSLVLFFHGLAPILVPIVGAHVTSFFSWRALFALISLYSLFVAGLYMFLFRESHSSPDRNALRIKLITRNFGAIAGHPVFWAYTCCSGAGFGILFSFLAASSHVIITFFGESETRFGYMFGGSMLGVMVGMLGGARLVQRIGSHRLLGLGVFSALFFALLLTGLDRLGIHRWPAVIIPMAFCMVSFSFMVPQAIAGALQPFPDRAGAASSLNGLVQQLIGAVTGIIVASLTAGGTQTALALGVLFWSLVAVVAYLLAIRRLHRRTD